jgi:hypothetical protein
MNLYLDTNVILPYFDCLIKNKLTPKVFKYLYNIKDKHKYFVSNLTKVEIFRYLHSIGSDYKDCQFTWNDFIKSLRVIELRIETIDFDEILKLVSTRPTRRGMIVNIIHLLFAKENRLIVLTGDKPLKDRFKVFYTEILTYEEFRKMYTNDI